MGDTLGWNMRQRAEEAKRAEEVLRGMGAGGRVEVGTPSSGEGWLRIGELQRRVCALFGCPALLRPFSGATTYPRALFEPGEIEVLREVFGQYARVSGDSGSSSDSEPGFGAQEQMRMPVSMIREAVRSVAGLGYAYDGVRESDFRYILREAGLSDLPEGEGRVKDVDFEEFVEVRTYSISHFIFVVSILAISCSFSCSCSHKLDFADLWRFERRVDRACCKQEGCAEEEDTC
jgi:glycerol-3-phosphate dehydrogenase